MTRRMRNLLRSISYDGNVCCKGELAPALSASVRNVENTYCPSFYFFFFFFSEGIAGTQRWVVVFCSASSGGEGDKGWSSLSLQKSCMCWLEENRV